MEQEILKQLDRIMKFDDTDQAHINRVFAAALTLIIQRLFPQ
jgi:hypothetical protein